MNWKRDTVDKLHELLTSGETIAVIDIHGVPADSMINMRANLRDNMKILVAKKRLMKIAWERAGYDEQDLETLYESAVQPALVATSTFNSFKLFTELKKTEAGRAAKPGDIAPFDIIVEKQDTGMKPGPIVGELNSVGIPAKIVSGSVHIQKTITVLNAGETFQGDLGMMLSKVGINPIITGLRLCGTIEDGVVFSPETLDIDYDQFGHDLVGYVAGAFNVACFIRWFTPETVPTLIAKASGEALSVAMGAEITNSETMPLFIARAHASLMGVAGALGPDALDDELAEMLGAAATAAASAASAVSTSESEAPAEAEEEEEDDEDAGFGGLGDLFG
jgi:large subunit ribosomal protein L10